MQPKHDIFAGQREALQKVSEENHESAITCMRFRLGGAHYLTAIEHVNEVAEIPEVTRFPDEVPHFQGLVALRGEILPLLQSQCNSQGTRGCKMLVLAFDKNRPFGVVVDQIKKVSVEAKNFEPGATLLLDGEAVLVAQESTFVA